MSNHTQHEFTVFVAEDEELQLNSLVKKIDKAELGFHVVGTAQTGDEALRQIARLVPDVVFTDIRMPVMDGLELLACLRQSHPQIKVVITSGFSDYEYMRTAIHHQACEYMLKPMTAPDIRETLLRLRSLLEQMMDADPPMPPSSDTQVDRQQYFSAPGSQADRQQYFSAPGSQADRQQYMTVLATEGRSQSEILEQLKVYLETHFESNQLNWNALAEKLGYNPSYLSRIYKQKFGESPSKYLISLQIQKAQTLLSQRPELSVCQVGQEIGYADQDYFSKLFKKQTGMSPSEFRRRSSLGNR